MSHTAITLLHEVFTYTFVYVKDHDLARGRHWVQDIVLGVREGSRWKGKLVYCCEVAVVVCCCATGRSVSHSSKTTN